jgi:8-oxo-dGTP pyrophosphatase MutT (NUDIX family)
VTTDRASGDGATVRFPVSVKGVVLRDDRVVLMSNPRGEWELPGGKLEPDETPEGCVAREIAEELGLEVAVGPIVDAWVYRIAASVDVLVVSYGCEARAWPERLESPEGKDVGLFPLDSLDRLNLPDGYRVAIRRWAQMR